MARLVTVTLNHRDRFSGGHLRRVVGYEAYHSGLMVTPEVSRGGDCFTFEARRDRTRPVTFRMDDAIMHWWLCIKEHVDAALNSKMLGRIAVGLAPSEVSNLALRAILENLPVKIRNPQQRCVTWVMDAIWVL